MLGHEITRFPRPARAGRRLHAESPVTAQICSQMWFDPILAAHAATFSSVRLAYRRRLTAFEDRGDRVVATIEAVDGGAAETVEAGYLVGCDGSRSGVRKALGIETEGQKGMGNALAAFFVAPDFLKGTGKAPATFYWYIDENGIWGSIRAIDPKRGLWRLGLMTFGDEEPDQSALQALLDRAVGHHYPTTFTDVSVWMQNAIVAERYGTGRVHLAGDAAHQLSPNGALGMNTGIGDAVDLSWKLEATLKGWGGSGLLESYRVERHAIGWRSVNLATQLLNTGNRLPGMAGLDDAGPEGERRRREMAALIEEKLAHQWRQLGMELGYRYDGSPIVVPDGSPAPPDDPERLTPTARPGARAPHAWLADGRSVLDLFGRGFVLLAFGQADAGGLVRAAEAAAIPLAVERIDDPAIAGLYERALVLVRPDGHVAWRADAPPADPPALLRQVTGG
jgi:2-polyprenyl-6-methoxyphenol hydroxylase-like FAD-dependent oxidoreductase